MNQIEKTSTKNSKLTFLCIIVILLFFIFLIGFWNILFPFILGVILAFLLDPFIIFLERFKIPRILGILITVVFLIIGIVFLLGYIIPATITGTVSSLTELITKLKNNDQLLHAISDYLAKYHINININDISNFIISKVNPIIGSAVNYSFIIAKLLVQGLKIWVLSFLTLVYILISRKSILLSIIEIIPNHSRKVVFSLYQSIITKIYQFILSLFIVSVMVFIFMWIFLNFFPESPAPFALALFSGILSMIPFLGGFLPPIFVLIVQIIYNTPINTMLSILIVETVLYSFIGLYLQPLMTGKTVKIHPLIILICIIIGGSIDGVFGVFLSVPVYIVIRTIFSYFFDKFKMEEGY